MNIALHIPWWLIRDGLLVLGGIVVGLLVGRVLMWIGIADAFNHGGMW